MLIIVPARKGSKGVPGKNTKPFCGHPLIEWSFAAAQEIALGLNAQIVCTTDDPAIEEMVNGQILMHARAAKLANDTATMADVVLDVCQRFNAERYILLQPTSPLRLKKDLANLVQATQANDAVASCTTPFEHPEDLIILNGAQGSPAVAADKTSRRQDRTTEYRFIDGSYYSGHAQTLRDTGSFLPADTHYQTLTIPVGVDIDAPHDWAMAEAQHDWLLAEGYEFVHPNR